MEITNTKNLTAEQLKLTPPLMRPLNGLLNIS